MNAVENRQDFNLFTLVPQDATAVLETDRMADLMEDIAGLVKGASKGEGLGNKFLANIRETDATIHVSPLRHFTLICIRTDFPSIN